MKAGSSGSRRSQASRRAWEAPGVPRTPPISATALIGESYLLLINLADGCCEHLCFSQGLIDCLTAGDHLGELLSNLVAKLLEFVAVDVLDDNVGDGIHRRVMEVRVCDRGKRPLGECAGRG